ncbi:Dihydrolipoyllysine-residue acetyltransferase component of acetoin cleaving system [Tepidimonas fonticaldi]|uniref:Dihydrolipoyllysine-residue acetyltransferase component of acetoin cleaving system n=1 Tax=Tepidimonas fonticaldi TaxID=1101373 RepID=A0A554XLS1_9BURK|nr:alpha/beta hydrolase [Tepidimonas fonticaldi]TSE36769.1 Dihydrolipoyllysine-residue acetyltransferase component of acetoin cleaving system [Tepidimonas fonticaldi]
MMIDVHGAPLYAYTGGKAFDPAQPTVVMIHGVLNDHSVWILQSRYLAHHGFNVLAIDLPGHGRSGGEPPARVADGARAVLGLLDALAVERAALAGHSFGSLIALQAAADAPQRVAQLALVGTAWPMRVSPALLDASLNTPEKAIAMVNVFSHSTLAPPPSALGPGTWLYGGSRALMRRVLASNPRVNVFHRGFVACDTYQDGEAAARRLACPVQFILGTRDQMTPPKAAQPLIDGARAAGVPVEVVRLPAGHALMTEAPDGVLDALRAFLGRMQAQSA